MSRWSPNRDSYKKYRKNNSTIWVNTPKRLYKITTDQQDFLVERYYLDYKKTIQNLKNAGYTNINITCLGRDVSF